MDYHTARKTKLVGEVRTHMKAQQVRHAERGQVHPAGWHPLPHSLHDLHHHRSMLQMHVATTFASKQKDGGTPRFNHGNLFALTRSCCMPRNQGCYKQSSVVQTTPGMCTFHAV